MVDLGNAIEEARVKLINEGYEVSSQYWQALNTGYHPGMTMIEILNHSFTAMPPLLNLEYLIKGVKPDLPWADDHFEERVSGIPHNPPPSHEWWPWHVNKNYQFMENEKFSHTYPERMWPKRTRPPLSEILGIRYNYGDTNDVINLLVADPYTRQAYLPIWFPEDTGAVHGERVPCTLGYHFIRRHEMLHMVYYIRSCDFLRHFRNDIYLSVKLLQWVLGRLREIANEWWKDVLPGTFTMHTTSLHIFKRELHLIGGEKK